MRQYVPAASTKTPAYNSAWEQYDHEEERAHRVAWAAVKNDYEKDETSGDWKKKDWPPPVETSRWDVWTVWTV